MNEPMLHGIEILVKKAAVDPAFKATLLQRRAAAAQEIGLELTAAEAAMLATVPVAQLDAIIGSTHVPVEHRRVFLGHAAAAMLAAVGVTIGNEALGQVQMMPAGVMAAPLPRPKPKTVEDRVLEVVNKQFRPVKPAPPPLMAVAGVMAQPVEEKPAKPAITRKTTLVKDLEVTPAGLIKLKGSLEVEFKITIPEAEFKKVDDVGQVIELVEKKVPKAANTPAERPFTGPISRAVRIDRPPRIPNPNPPPVPPTPPNP